MNIDDEILTLIDKLKNEGNYNILEYVYNDTRKFIPGETPVLYSGPYWDDKEIVAAIKSLLIGKWISAGENVKKFEDEFAKVVNNKYSVMVNSGSSANLLMLAALKKVYEWQDGSEIIVSPVGFPTTIAPIIQNNLKPVFVDIEFDTLNFNLNLIKEKITNKTVAIFLSPVLGNPPNMDRLLGICKQYELELVLDNCDSLGTKWNDLYLNEYAVASSYSFYPAHHISTGEGGMITSDNLDVVRISKSMSYWSRSCQCSGTENLLPKGICGKRFSNWLENYDGIIDHKYLFVSPMGYNLKPLDLQGSIGLEQIKKLPEIHTNRKYSHDIITQIFLRYIPSLKIPHVLSESDVSWFGTPFICTNKEQKNKLVAHLEKSKIQTRNYFAGNLLLHEGYKHLGNYKDYPQANEVLNKIFFVGASPSYEQNVFDYIEEVLQNYE